MTKRSRLISAPDLLVLSVILFGVLFSRYPFTALVAYRTACFASGLASASAFAATRYLFFCGLCYSFNHTRTLLSLFFINYRIRGEKNQAI